MVVKTEEPVSKGSEKKKKKKHKKRKEGSSSEVRNHSGSLLEHLEDKGPDTAPILCPQKSA